MASRSPDFVGAGAQRESGGDEERRQGYGWGRFLVFVYIRFPVAELGFLGVKPLEIWNRGNCCSFFPPCYCYIQRAESIETSHAC